MAERIANNYPFITSDNQYIPACILRPSRFYLCTAGLSIVLEASDEVIQVESIGGPSVLYFGETAPTIIGETAIANAMYIPWGGMQLIAIPAGLTSNKVHVLPLSVDTEHCLIQVVEAWKAMDQSRTFIKKF